MTYRELMAEFKAMDLCAIRFVYDSLMSGDPTFATRSCRWMWERCESVLPSGGGKDKTLLANALADSVFAGDLEGRVREREEFLRARKERRASLSEH